MSMCTAGNGTEEKFCRYIFPFEADHSMVSSSMRNSGSLTSIHLSGQYDGMTVDQFQVSVGSAHRSQHIAAWERRRSQNCYLVVVLH